MIIHIIEIIELRYATSVRAFGPDKKPQFLERREPRGLPFYYQCRQFLLLLSPLARRQTSFHEPFETAGILLDEWEEQV
jgi:hypothetical protein